MSASTDLCGVIQAAARGCSRVVFVLVASAALSGQPAQPAFAQAEAPPDVRVGASTAPRLARLRQAIETHRRHARSLRRSRDIVGSGVGLDAQGEPVIEVFTARAGVPGLPHTLDGLRVRPRVSGRYYARRDPTCETSGDGLCSAAERWPLPIPIGVSIGHPAVTAGTIGARVTDGDQTFILSNNHVLANANQSNNGDGILQPGDFDGGRFPDDVVATLWDSEPLRFCQIFWIWMFCDQSNTIDAAVAVTSSVDASTPLGEFGSEPGFGVPSRALHPAFGDPVVLGDESLAQLVGLSVQKYGRTTGLTVGTIEAVNATIDVCYDVNCLEIARFVDQLVIGPGGFSAGGDSGSLIVGLGAQPQAIGLLFAGSDTSTLANRIDLVLNRFGMEIDEGTPSAPFTDLATTNLAVSGIPEVGLASELVATIRNVGNQDIVESFDVVLTEDGLEMGREALLGLTAGASSDVAFDWTPATEGVHPLRVSHTLAGDDEPANDTVSADVAVAAPGSGGTPGGVSLELWQGIAHTDAWTTVTLAENYGSDMVVVCTPSVSGSELGPTVARVRNASASSFEVGLARPWFGALAGEHWSGPVHCMVTRAGVYTAGEHGVAMEAVRLDGFTPTDNSSSWQGQPQVYANSYSAPVVLGQVIGGGAQPGAIGDWSIFWSRGTARNRPASSTALFVGRHTGEDPTGRAPETLAYLVIESGSGQLGGVGYTAAVGSDSVRGVGNAPPYDYPLSGLATASTAIVSQAGMDGGNGGWAVLYGPDPIAPDQLSMACEEDWYRDSERKHTTEQFGYIVFE